jgi:NADPH:quinone reductase-like Zn-dependent oxidoreductase
MAAALPNPGVSAWLTLKERAKLAPGETVLILGATGVTGKLAVQIAKILGAGRVIAAGRNEKALNSLLELGADATIQSDKTGVELTKVFAREASDKGFQVVIDYLWGPPTEALLAALTRNEFAAIGRETRLVQVGESAGAAISLPAAVLRSAPLTIMGTAGMPAPEILTDALQQVLAYGASGKLRIDTERVPLIDVESAWQREGRSRLVFIP